MIAIVQKDAAALFVHGVAQSKGLKQWPMTPLAVETIVVGRLEQNEAFQYDADVLLDAVAVKVRIAIDGVDLH